MRFGVSHESTYRYSTPVRLADHVLRLMPRPEYVADVTQELVIEPEPAWLSEEIDPFGNPVIRVGFTGETPVLRIVSRITAETIAPPASLAAMAEAAQFLGEGEAPEIEAFAAQIAADTGGDDHAFLYHLTRTLHQRIKHGIRLKGQAQSPVETLQSSRGACRDVTVLFIALGRARGIPARFTSGYQAFAQVSNGTRHLHAWPEAFLPGIGWRAYDPTHGRAVGETHLPLATAPEQRATMPVQGGYFGSQVTSSLDFHIHIDAG